MENNKNDLPTITGILIQDPDDNGYTAYFAEFPEVIAEGKDETEAKKTFLRHLKPCLRSGAGK